MCSSSLANVLSLVQQQFSALDYQVQQRLVALSHNNFQEYSKPTCDSALTKVKKDVNTPELAQLIQYECPFPLGHNL